MSSADVSCFDFVTPSGNRPLRLEEGVRLVLAAASASTPTELVDLMQAQGRILAETQISPIAVPPARNSAMDGYAILSTDLNQLETWQLVGESLAGHPWTGPLRSGQAVMITTGACLPSGADTVVMQEMCERVEDQLIIRFQESVQPGQHIREAGEDIALGSAVLYAGQRIGPVEAGLLASIGIEKVKVHQALKVALFSTGDEVSAPGEPLTAGAIYDSNRYSLAAVLQALGCEVMDLGILPDHPQAIHAALTVARSKARLVITSGGVSVGEADHIRSVLNRLGQTGFWQLAVRPGRPFAFGDLGAEPGQEPCLFAALPGNPVAALVTFMLILQPLIRRLQGETDWVGLTWSAKATERMKSRLGRSDFHRGIYNLNAEGVLEVRSTGAQGSGILTSMHQGNCLIRIPEETASLAPGDKVSIYPFSGWLPGYPAL